MALILTSRYAQIKSLYQDKELKGIGRIREMRTVKLSGVFYEMAREQTKKRQFRKIEDYIETLIRNDYENKNSRP